MVSRVTGGVTFVPGMGYVESALLAQPTLIPQPTAQTTAPATLTQEAESAATGIEPQQLQAILYGKDIPVFVGGKMRIGGRIIEGPFFGGDSDAPTVSYIASHAVCANPAGTRSITEFSLRGRVAWTSTDGALLDGLTVEFKTGSESQTPFSSSVTRYGDSAIAYRGHILSCVTDLPLSTFAGVVPFPSVLVEDSTHGDPDDGITREDALETILRYARLEDAEFEVDVTGSDIAWIIGQKVELVPFLQQLRKIFVNWNVTVTDKLRIIEPGAFSVDAQITRDNHIARSMKFTRAEPLTKPREKVYKFIDIDRDYEPNAATARQELFPFPTTASIESETIELPIVTTASQAVADANYALFQAEVARKQIAYTGMVSLLGQEAGDGIHFEDHDHFRFRGRVLEVVKNAADWTVDVKAETWLNCGVDAETPTAEHVNCYLAEVTATTHTITNVDFGAASAERRVVLALSLELNALGQTIDSVTIGGVAATEIIAASNTGLGLISALWYAAVPSGASGSVKVTCSGAFTQIAAHVYRVVSSSFAVHDSDSDEATSSNPSVSLDIPAGGVAIAVAATRHGAAFTWSGATVDCVREGDLVTGYYASASHEVESAETGYAISITIGSADRSTLAVGSITL